MILDQINVSVLLTCSVYLVGGLEKGVNHTLSMFLKHFCVPGPVIMERSGETITNWPDIAQDDRIVNIFESRRGGWKFVMRFEGQSYYMYKRRINMEGLVQLECIDRACRALKVLLKNTSQVQSTNKEFWRTEHFEVERIRYRAPHNCPTVEMV